MSYLRYLTALNTSLREAVLPEMTSGRGRDAVNNAITALAAIAAQLERVSCGALGAIDLAALPIELRELAPALVEDAPLQLALAKCTG